MRDPRALAARVDGDAQCQRRSERRGGPGVQIVNLELAWIAWVPVGASAPTRPFSTVVDSRASTASPRVSQAGRDKARSVEVDGRRIPHRHRDVATGGTRAGSAVTDASHSAVRSAASPHT